MEIPSIEQFDSNSILPFSLDYSGNKDKKNIPSIEEDSSLSKKATSNKTAIIPAKPSFDKFQPQTDWNLNSQIGSIQDFYQSKFGTNLPAQLGQKAIHNKWGFDHRNAVDVNLNPNSDEGKKLVSYLKENNIPYLAFTHAIDGVATGSHIHIGFASHKTNKKYSIGTTLSADNIPSIEDESIPAIDNIDSLSQEPKQQTQTQPQIPSILDAEAGIGIASIPSIKVEPFKTNLTLEERIAQGASNVGLGKQIPRITVENPSNLVGSPIITTINSYHKPTINEAIDAWLSSIGKNGSIYSEMNKEYREYTGTNLVRFDLSGGGRMVVPLKSNQYKIQGQLTQDSLDVLNAYISARNKGGPKDAAEAAFLKGQENDRKMQIVYDEIKQNKAPETVGEQFLKAHPYLAATLVINPIMQPAVALATAVKGLQFLSENAPDFSTSFSPTINGVPIYLGKVGTRETPKDILSGLASAIGKDAQLVHNLRTLPEALYKLERYGGDSQEYDDLMERDRQVQANLNKNQGSIYQPKDIIGKSVAGATSGLVDLPKYALAGQFGGAYALPILSYIEEMHRGNREATMAALPMAIMGGAGHGLNEFLGAGTRFNFNTFDEDGNPVNKTVELGQGLGNRAPFTLRNIRDYALKDKWSNKFGYPINVSIESAPTSIKHLTSLERQLLLRGSNALFMGGTQLGTQIASQNPTWNSETKRWEYSPISVDPNSLASSFVIGLTFPVGKNRVGDYSKPSIIENPPIDSPSQINLVPQLDQPRVNISLANPTGFGKFPIIESETRNVGDTFVPSYQSPDNKYKETTTPIEPNLEKGFQARNTATTLHLDLDTAALNYLELKRALVDKTFVKPGAPMLDNTTRMLAVQRAISTLEKSIPEQTRKFFEDHEQEIRAAIRTNFEAQQSKVDFLKLAGEQSQIAQEQNPSNIKPNENAPSIGESLVDRLKNQLNIFNKNPTDETASAILGETGSQNVGIKQTTYLKAVDRTLGTKSKDGIEYRRSGLTLDDMKESGKAVVDLTTIAAFHLEDFYHRRIEPSLSEFANRMRLSLGDLVKNFSDKDFQTVFSKGQEYLDLNRPTPENMEPKEYANYLKNLSKDERDNISQYENFPGYMLYEAQKLIPKVDGQIKKLTDSNSHILYQDADAIINVNDEPFLLSKFEDPDAPDDFPKIFVWAYAPVEDYTKSVETTTSDPVELRNEIAAFQESKLDILSKNELPKSNEFGVRNRVIEIDPFNKAREDLVNSVLNSSNKEVINEDGHAFNSSLPPSAFLDLIKLNYSDVKDFAEFSRKVIQRFGEGIRDYVEGLWYSTKGTAQDFKSKLNVDIDNFSSSMKEIAENAAWKIRQAHEDERGFLNLGKNKSKELEEYFSDDSKHQGTLWTDGRSYMRMIALAQLNTKFSEAVYEPMRLIQRVMASYESNIVQQLKSARKVLKNYQNAVDAIYDGNEQKRTWTAQELQAKGLSADEIGAYQNIRKAMNNVLNLRLNTRLYSIDKKATTLNDKLLTLTPNSPQWTDVANQLIDLGQIKQKTIDHFQNLKDTGYISLQRRGKVAAFLEDPNFPVGDSRRKVYNQFDSYKEADAWLQRQKVNLGIAPDIRTAKTIKHGEIYDLQNLKDIAFREKLTPSQFEDLVDRSGAKVNDPEIEKIRSEVYSRYPSMTYQLDREFIRGYDKTSENVIESIAHQADLYGASFYSSVGGEQALEGLEKSGLQHSDPNLYKIAMNYIKDETAPSQLGLAGKAFAKARKFTYFYQLAFDVNQLYLNAVAQPITQTYGYFSRVEVNGLRLNGLEPEQYFTKAGKLTTETLLGKAPQLFQDLVNKLTSEHVLQPEFQKSLLEYETAPSVAKGIARKTVGHWGSVFMRGGERVTRIHAAAEAYLIGTEKFNLSGDSLESFMVRAVDATQSNPTRGENPYYVRQFGEGGKLIYQFMAFNHMWWENLALGTVLDKTGTLGQKAKFATRELYPLILMGGLTGLPLSGFAHFMATILTGDDPKKKFNRMLGKNSWLENFTLYGFSGNASLSQKLTPSAPVLDNADESLTGNKTLQEYVPAVMTIEQIVKGLKNVSSGLISGNSRMALYGVEQGSPRALRGVVRAVDYGHSGVKNAKGETTIPRSKLSPIELVAQGLNISPNEVTNYYNKRRTEELAKKSRDSKVLRKIQRISKQIY